MSACTAGFECRKDRQDFRTSAACITVMNALQRTVCLRKHFWRTTAIHRLDRLLLRPVVGRGTPTLYWLFDEANPPQLA
jgi:hypothetical protein